MPAVPGWATLCGLPAAQVAQGMADALREVRESWPDLLASARGPAAPGGRPGHEPNEPPRPHAAGGAPGAGPGAPAGEPGRSGGEQASARARGSDAGEDDAGEEAPRRTAVNGAAGCAAPPPASAAAAGGSGGGCGANEEDGEDHKGDDRDEDSSVLGFEVDELSGAERGVAAAAADLLESARAALCLAARTLLRAPGLDAAGVAAWASAAWHARQLGTAANDLGAGAARAHRRAPPLRCVPAYQVVCSSLHLLRQCQAMLRVVPCCSQWAARRWMRHGKQRCQLLQALP